ncbi:hypothetical protein D3C71_1896820 [compost metagenome]
MGILDDQVGFEFGYVIEQILDRILHQDGITGHLNIVLPQGANRLRQFSTVLF